MDKNRDQTPETIGGPTDRRTLNVMLGTAALNQFDQTRRSKNERSEVKGDKREWLPLPLRIVSFISGWFLLAGVIGFIMLFLRVSGESLPMAMPMTKIGLSVGVPIYGGLRLLESYLERRDWVKRMRESDEQRKREKNTP